MATRFDTPATDCIAHALEDAPAWTKLGLAAPGERIRERSIERLASFIAERLDNPPAISDEDQFKLAL